MSTRISGQESEVRRVARPFITSAPAAEKAFEKGQEKRLKDKAKTEAQAWKKVRL